jgi:hypothetical protein
MFEQWIVLLSVFAFAFCFLFEGVPLEDIVLLFRFDYDHIISSTIE